MEKYLYDKIGVVKDPTEGDMDIADLKGYIKFNVENFTAPRYGKNLTFYVFSNLDNGVSVTFDKADTTASLYSVDLEGSYYKHVFRITVGKNPAPTTRTITGTVSLNVPDKGKLDGKITIYQHAGVDD
jgi:hypothetical protein